MASQGCIIEHRLEDSGSGNPPNSFATERHFEQSPFGPQLFQVPQPACGVVPALPKAFAHVPPDPAFHAKDVAAFLGQPIGGPPTLDIRAPAVPQLFTAPTLTAPPPVPDFGFQPLHTLRGRFGPAFPVNPKPQKLPFPRPPRDITFFGDVRKNAPLPPTPQTYGGCTAQVRVGQSGVVTAVVTPRRFGRLPGSFSVPHLAWFCRSSALRSARLSPRFKRYYGLC